MLDLELWDLKVPPQWGYPGIFHGTSWTWDSGTSLPPKLGRLGMSWDISWDSLDLELWDLTLPPQLGRLGMSQDIPWDILDLGPYTVSMGWTSQDVPEYPMGHLGSGTVEPYSASTVRISQDVLRCPKTSWTCMGLWDFTLSPQLGDILGCPEMS